MELPQLPAPVEVARRQTANQLTITHAYSGQQMRAYAAAAVAQERERCAKLCDAMSNDWHGHDGKYALEDAANRIRATLPRTDQEHPSRP